MNPLSKPFEDRRGRITHKRVCSDCPHVETAVEIPVDEMEVYDAMIDVIDKFTSKFGENSLALLLDVPEGS